MKITSISSYHVAYPLPQGEEIRSSQMIFDERSVVVVKVETDEGLVGWGESLGQPEITIPVIDNVLTPLIIGKDPLDTGVLWSSMARGTWFRAQSGVLVEALSALDIALWDIKGKALEKPIYSLLGGAFRTRIPVYATGMYLNSAENLQQEAEKHISNGFLALKMKIGYPEGIERDLERISQVRQVIGPEIKLMVDANGKYDLSTAISISQELAAFDVCWLEEPLKPNGPYHDLDGYRQLKALSGVPIAWGEGQYLVAEIKDYLVDRVIDIIQPDVCRFGGITETYRVSPFASQFNIRFAPHFWTTGIGLAATLQISAAADQNFLISEFDQSFNPLREELTNPEFKVIDGKVNVPEGSGLGVEINEEFLKKCVVNQ